MKFILLLSTLCLFACATPEVSPSGANPMGLGQYSRIVDQNSDKARRYSGFYNTLDIEATVLRPNVMQAQLEYSATLYQWDEKKFLEEKGKMESRLSKESEIFMSFFTPERKNDDLSKKNTMWKIFLDVDGKRYEGKATKIKLQLAEIEALYPYHNRFYTPYTVVFPIAMKSIERRPLEVTVTGVVGSGTLKFALPASN